MSDLELRFDRAKKMLCGVCNGEGDVDGQKCPYCAGKGTYGEQNDIEVIEVVDLGEF